MSDMLTPEQYDKLPERTALIVCSKCGRNDRRTPIKAKHYAYTNGKLCDGTLITCHYSLQSYHDTLARKA